MALKVCNATGKLKNSMAHRGVEGGSAGPMATTRRDQPGGNTSPIVTAKKKKKKNNARDQENTGQQFCDRAQPPFYSGGALPGEIGRAHV